MSWDTHINNITAKANKKGKLVPGDIKYIFTKFYRHISTNNEANRKFVILISNFSTSL